MKASETILLPGTGRQTEILTREVKDDIKNILVIGPGTIKPGMILRDNYNAEVIEIVEDEDSLLFDRLRIKGERDISVKMMDYTNTDFKKDHFDMIYAQGSVSGKRRAKIIKEVKRILKINGIFTVGEIVSTAPGAPQFVKDVWESSDIMPLNETELASYYTSKNFDLLYEQDLQPTLTEYYSVNSEMLGSVTEGLKPNEKSYYKKILNRISHESNVYLKLRGQRYMGFRMLILRKTGE